MKLIKYLTASVAAASALFCFAPAAMAQSTDIYPASHTVSTSTTPITIGTYNCTLNLHSFTTPAKGNPTGPVTINFSTRPTIEACSGTATVETSGTWSMTVQYGAGGAVLNIPAGGFNLSCCSGLGGISNSAFEWKWTWSWNNGFTSPVSVSSTLGLIPSTNKYYSHAELKEVTASNALSTLSDVTSPGSLLLLGP
jgi:hypothetical protein